MCKEDEMEDLCALSFSLRKDWDAIGITAAEPDIMHISQMPANSPPG